MDDITITFNTVLQLFGAIAVIGGGVKIIISMFSPFQKLRQEVDKLKEFLANDKKRLEEGDERMKAIDAKIERQDKALALIGLTLSEMIEHTVTNNDIDSLKARQKELNAFFYGGEDK